MLLTLAITVVFIGCFPKIWFDFYNSIIFRSFDSFRSFYFFHIYREVHIWYIHLAILFSNFFSMRNILFCTLVLLLWLNYFLYYHFYLHLYMFVKFFILCLFVLDVAHYILYSLFQEILFLKYEIFDKFEKKLVIIY